jgi:hypothetical protein
VIRESLSANSRVGAAKDGAGSFVGRYLMKEIADLV